MLKRLGCTCCEAEDSYDLERNPVYDPKRREAERELKSADNKALETEYHPSEDIVSFDDQPLSQSNSADFKETQTDSAFVSRKEIVEGVEEILLPGALPDIVSDTDVDPNAPSTVRSHHLTDQSETENRECDTKNKESDTENKESDTENKESETENKESDTEGNESETESKESETENKESDLSDSEQDEDEMANNVVPKITKPAPDFSGQAVVKGTFKEISLSDYKGKYLVFFFYPLDFTFVCPTEIIAFSDRAEEFRNINCEVVACSTDSHFCHLAWVNMPRKQGGLGDMKIPLLADKNCSIAKSYGVYKEDEGVTFRGLFIIDDKGNLRQVTINDLPVGRSVDETLRLVQAFQFTDKHGEVCPAGWKPGQDTMKPDPKGKMEYFGKKN